MRIIILAGGNGTRLWPLSRPSYPKQFLKLNNEPSFLQKSVLRFLKKYSAEDLVIVTQKEVLHLVKAQVSEIDPKLAERIVIEPIGRNTAPATALAIKWLQERDELSEDECVLITPSDQLFSPAEHFLDKLEIAEKEAKAGQHVLFGISPSSPHTGYGYMQCSPQEDVSDVELFVEKPKVKDAAKMLEEGNWLWNMGVFVFQVKALLKDLHQFQPKIAEAMEGSYEEMVMSFADLPNLSIDYAVIEKTSKCRAIPLFMSWSDVGSWDSLYDVFPKDEQHNVKEGNIVDIDTKNCLILGDKRLVTTIDLEDIMIVDTDDALLVAKRGSSQKIKELVQILQERNSRETKEHRTMYRPWGSYTILEEQEGYKMKKISVTPGQKLSLQYHHHRSEHWVVVKGTAKITLDEKEIILKENESVFVPKLMEHRLENAQEELLEMIEVQVGDYLGEDDIVRIEDIYGRIESANSINH